MWIFLSDCFFSIVHKDCKRDELLVRARRPGDIERVFPGDVVRCTRGADYLYRATIGKASVAWALARELDRVVYSNFKDSVTDKPLHDAYLKVWNAMSAVQPLPPFGIGIMPEEPPPPARARRKKKRAPKKLRRGQ